MKKIKRFYKEHRVFTILMAVVIVCVILIVTVLIQCFYVGNGSDKYGNRLDGIENYKIEDSRINDFEHNQANNDKVESVDVIITGKIIYITFKFTEKTDLVEAESIALKSLEEFSAEEQGFYDFNITLKKDATEKTDGFVISGAKNANGSGLKWNNNREVTNTETNSDATEKDE